MGDEQLFQRFGKEFTRGTVLFKEGEPGKEMFVVQQGRVNISKRVGAVEKILVTLGAGEFFGEMSILNNKPRSATATCAEDAKILVIDPRTFEAMIRGNAEIAVRMIKKLADRLQEADHQIENLLLKDVSSRVVHYLALAAEKGTRGAHGSATGLTPRDVPGRVGAEAAQVDEILGKLVRARILLLEADQLVVPEVAKLRQFLQFLQMKAEFGDVA
jgi:CRP/FNR family transcriptional regulator, cyclic AMP receptor protein